MSNENLNGKVAVTPEILGAQLSDSTRIDAVALKADANNYIKANYDADLVSAISIVENTADTMHLSLPYYDGLELAVASIKDEDLEDVDGGILGIIIAIAIAASAATAAVAVGVGIGVHEAKQNK